MATKKITTTRIGFKVYVGGSYKNVALEKALITEIAQAAKQVKTAVATRSKSAPHLLRRVVTK